MNRISRSAVASVLLLAFCAVNSPRAGATTLDPCDGSCTWSIMTGGVQVASGDFSVNATTGDVNFTSPVMVGLGGGAWAGINGLSGNSDPILGFNVSANTGVNARTFSFTFSMPTSLSGIIDTSSSVSYSLTSQTTKGAQITPLNTSAVTAQDVDTTAGGLSPLNAGVDTGDRFFFTGAGTQTSSIFTASNTHAGNPAYDLMSVTLGFSLTANSSVGVSGFVEEAVADPSPVPVPAGLWLLGSGLLGGGWLSRRRGTGFDLGRYLMKPTYF